MFKLFNTLTRSIEDFRAIKKGQVRMYTCGPTVYDFAHIGNYRAYICSDILRRWLEYSGYEVRQVMNLTDIDDKTIRDSQKHNMSLKDFTAKYITAFFEDIDALNIERANEYPKATDYIDEMVRLIKTLMEKGFAYRGEDGSIYFSVRKFPDYGKLSRVKISELEQGASGRVKSDEYEREQANDFALWKAWDKNDGDVFWESDFGKGRPGWHIECSAMATKYLGNQFDIHCGGIDHIPVHHTNEIAQSEAAIGKKPWVKYWLHNAFLELTAGKKMAKSGNNFITLATLEEKGFHPLDYRYFCLGTHYRNPLMFSYEALEGAKIARRRLVDKVLELKLAKDKEQKEAQKKYLEQFTQEINDDLNTSQALATVWDMLKDEKLSNKDKYTLLVKCGKVLGLDLAHVKKDKISKEIIALAKQRLQARQNKEWKKSDELRDKIKQLGYIIGDTREGYEIRKA
ncbi:TPA: cysteine--tRNA ligase [Candidatus Woesearchaeota archaeon]|nr:cysteine--tRNA ligase [Candidatus Woesearchaeota archaeon]